MIDKILKGLQQAGESLKEQAGNIGESAKEKSYQIIEDWVAVFPKLEGYGLRITSFSLAVAINPSLEVEFVGSHVDFTEERLATLLEENKNSAILRTIFTTIRTTYRLHQRINHRLEDPLILKLKVRLSPEVRVFIGKPEVL
jgi:hypothetical protein